MPQNYNIKKEDLDSFLTVDEETAPINTKWDRHTVIDMNTNDAVFHIGSMVRKTTITPNVFDNSITMSRKLSISHTVSAVDTA